MVNLDLNRYNRAIKYVTLGKNKGYDLYHSNGRFGLIYAFALVDFCRVTRLIEASDPRVPEYLDEAIKIFDKMGHKTGPLGARLERTQWQAISKSFDKALENSDKLAKRFQEAGLHDEYLETGLLIAKIHKIMYDYEQANEKIDQLLEEALEMGLGRERISAELWFIKGTIFTAYNLDRDAFESFRESAKIGMALGLKNIIIRAFNAARKINPYPARELITSDLVYQDAIFVRDRLRQKVTPFATRKTKAKLFASTLFLDIAGFSSIMQKSDEDTTVAMIDELIDRLCLIIYRNKGYIDKFLGNGFMAIFEHGEQPNPDTAYGAVRSGIDILRSLNHKNRKLRQVYGINKKIEIRMGISTGEIYAMVLGNYIKREYTYLGNAVNLAAKLESLASKYQILIDQETFQQTSDRIMAKREDVTITDLGDLEAYQVIRLSRLAEREEYPETAMEEPA
jgi:class 3 adenylate cyclase